jgi:hypothetical protein
LTALTAIKAQPTTWTTAMHKILITFSCIAVAILSHGQDRTLFDFNMETAYEALGQSDYQRALKFFAEAQASPILQKQEKDMINLKMLVDELAGLVQKRKDLGAIHPSVRHKVAVLYVEKVDGTYEKSLGEKVKVNKTLSDDEKKAARNRLDVMREIYEALSGGNFTIDFDEISVTEPLKSIRLVDGKPWPYWDYFDGAAEIIRKNFDTHDTFIWCTNLIQGEAHGGSSRFPLGEGQLTPPKGFIEVNPTFSRNIWIHEFFHVVEGMVGITPSHGHHKENKARFPDWPGRVDNELDYYTWQFNTTIPAKGWGKLKISTKLSDEAPAKPLAYPDGYKTVGKWTPREVTNDWSVQEWKINIEKIPAGPINVMMHYTHGWKALDIAWVALWQDGKQIAMDEHFGFSGTEKRNIVYAMDLPQDLKGTFHIKAKVKGDNGTDSNGDILMKVGQ